MSEIAILGAGAFGTSLAMALSLNGAAVTLWCRNPEVAENMRNTRTSPPRLPGHNLPKTLSVEHDLTQIQSPTLLLAVPMQSLANFLQAAPDWSQRTLVACCKGIDRQTGLGPFATVKGGAPSADAALLTGPSFAADIAKGLPTALTLAAPTDSEGLALQNALSRPALRLYRTTDTIGAELGGALKNVIALAAGMAIGAGFGDSARAAVIARGFAEMTRYSMAKGAQPETLQGLSGLGDLVLTCTSEKSRNFSAGVAFGRGETPDMTSTTEGIATAEALAIEAELHQLDMPLTTAIHAVTTGKIDVHDAVGTLLARPVKQE
ncbi:NAD(P)H-dependent glycerol-3-phosphate dehydrogenase [Boseongicola aestuarii]|uniref:Glycerol-3-phosphate dehydrogenase [NAD(P)+] n=1 Tax=Boseongicola aestuarii TaxID=1470561 RepID=A0A238J321_9RHOB|nr:NAD(P)H-dependent glycerol-3-phosphate dehydrogenase [Boseongicola aestuarii]SMX25017.1 Glycerol-3-phosphate dehydrogenase [NAD(P)+] [Boseongicola aestuarii]